MRAIRARLNEAAGAYMRPQGMPAVDFTKPEGEPALAGPDSISWQVFKNPVGLFIGGIAAVLLELAEPRVRTGVWEHTSFRTDPLPRMKRTGLAAMVTVYGARTTAERMIAGVGRMHGRVEGTTPAGAPYRALDPELLDWVQATAGFGFLEAYHAFVRPLTEAEKDRFYSEGGPAARLYGAMGAPSSRAELEAQFQRMRPKLERSEIIFEFLAIIGRTPALPGPLGLMQDMMVRAAIDILPPWTRELLGLDVARWRLRGWERWLIRRTGALADRIPLASAPPAQACLRLGLPANYLYSR